MTFKHTHTHVVFNLFDGWMERRRERERTIFYPFVLRGTQLSLGAQEFAAQYNYPTA